MKRIVVALIVAVGQLSAAAEKKLSAREEIARLEKELAAQRALLVRMLELQNACTAQMIRAAQGLDFQTPVMSEAAPVAVAPPAATVPAPQPERAPERAPERTAPTTTAPRTVAAKTATLSGSVKLTRGDAAWVFVEDVTGTSTGSVEIKQEDKQFLPNKVAVPLGTKVAFPNLDVVYHNVFSLTPGQKFDLGMQRAGDPVKSKVMSKPGVVEIFCNLHSRMSATILVTPGPLVTKVSADGSFKLENVPVGTHRVTAWAGGQALSTQSVEVGPTGATLQFQIAAPEQGAHTNKDGQPYGSYGD
jgi:plastocyanin